MFFLFVIFGVADAVGSKNPNQLLFCDSKMQFAKKSSKTLLST